MAACAVWLAAGAARADPPRVALPVVLHVAGGAPDDYVRTLLAAAHEAYATSGICIVPSFRALPDASRELRTIRDRHTLKRLLVPGAVNVFLVDHALDPHPSASTQRAAERVARPLTGRLGGAHIPAPSARPRTYIIVTRDAQRFTLAHELGHLLGAGHHRDPANIMSYGADRHTFDAAQLRTFFSRARALVARHDVARVNVAACTPDAG